MNDDFTFQQRVGMMAAMLNYLVEQDQVDDMKTGEKTTAHLQFLVAEVASPDVGLPRRCCSS